MPPALARAQWDIMSTCKVFSVRLKEFGWTVERGSAEPVRRIKPVAGHFVGCQASLISDLPSEDKAFGLHSLLKCCTGPPPPPPASSVTRAGIFKQLGLPTYLYDAFANDVYRLTSKRLRDKITVAVSFAFMCDLQQIKTEHLFSVADRLVTS
jgi:hypothetical protein